MMSKSPSVAKYKCTTVQCLKMIYDHIKIFSVLVSDLVLENGCVLGEVLGCCPVSIFPREADGGELRPLVHVVER